MGMKQDLKNPKEGGLPAKEFLKEYGIPKSKDYYLFYVITNYGITSLSVNSTDV